MGRAVYRLLSLDGSFELFPNGHARFLTASGLRKVNAGRAEAILRNDDDHKPFAEGAREEVNASTAWAEAVGGVPMGRPGAPAYASVGGVPMGGEDAPCRSAVDDLREQLMAGGSIGSAEGRARADGGEAWDTDSTAILSEYPGSITVRAMARKGRTIDVSADDVIQVVFVLGGAKRGDTASLRVRRVFGGCMDYVNLLVDGSAGRGARSRSRRNAYMVCTRA